MAEVQAVNDSSGRCRWWRNIERSAAPTTLEDVRTRVTRRWRWPGTGALSGPSRT